MIPKFRAWHLKEKRMFNVGHIYFPDVGKYILVADYHENSLDCPKEVILMQSIGLNDKKEKEIYEGDIIKIYDFKSSWIVAWNKEATARTLKISKATLYRKMSTFDIPLAVPDSIL